MLPDSLDAIINQADRIICILEKENIEASLLTEIQKQWDMVVNMLYKQIVDTKKRTKKSDPLYPSSFPDDFMNEVGKLHKQCQDFWEVARKYSKTILYLTPDYCDAKLWTVNNYYKALVGKVEEKDNKKLD